MQLHQKKRSKSSLSDEWETPLRLFSELCLKYDVNCMMDVACTDDNCLTVYRLPKGDSTELPTWSNAYKSDVWCNPPHSQNEKFVRKAYDVWKKENLNIMMILPANTMSSQYWHDCIEGIAEYHPIKGRIRFEVNGNPSKYPSRNAYVVVIWRKRQ